MQLSALVAKLDELDANASIETRNFVEMKLYVQKGVVDAFKTLAQERKTYFEWVSKETDVEANQIFRVEKKVKMAKQHHCGIQVLVKIVKRV